MCILQKGLRMQITVYAKRQLKIYYEPSASTVGMNLAVVPHIGTSNTMCVSIGLYMHVYTYLE